MSSTVAVISAPKTYRHVLSSPASTESIVPSSIKSSDSSCSWADQVEDAEKAIGLLAWSLVREGNERLDEIDHMSCVHRLFQEMVRQAEALAEELATASKPGFDVGRFKEDLLRCTKDAVAQDSSQIDLRDGVRALCELCCDQRLRSLAWSLVRKGSKRLPEIDDMSCARLHKLIQEMVRQALTLAQELATTSKPGFDVGRFKKDLIQYIDDNVALNSSQFDLRGIVRTLCGHWCDQCIRSGTSKRWKGTRDPSSLGRPAIARVGRDERPLREERLGRDETAADVSVHIKLVQMKLADLCSERRELDATILYHEALMKGLFDTYDRLVKDRVSRAGQAQA